MFTCSLSLFFLSWFNSDLSIIYQFSTNFAVLFFSINKFLFFENWNRFCSKILLFIIVYMEKKLSYYGQELLRFWTVYLIECKCCILWVTYKANKNSSRKFIFLFVILYDNFIYRENAKINAMLCHYLMTLLQYLS